MKFSLITLGFDPLSAYIVLPFVLRASVGLYLCLAHNHTLVDMHAQA